MTVAAILEAATRVIAEDSLAGFNTNRVAEVAGVSIGSLYQYFPNKDALVAALIADTQERLAAEVERCVQQGAGLPLATTLAALVDVAMAHQWQHPVLAAALDQEEQRLAVADVLAAAERRLVAATVGLLERHRDEVAGDDPVLCARDCLTIVKALVEAERVDRPPPSLKARIMRALRGYLAQGIKLDEP